MVGVSSSNFNVLNDQGKTFGIFTDATIVPSLTFWQLPFLGAFRDQVQSYAKFKELCSGAANATPDKKLPAYSFVEPRFTPEFLGIEQPSDYHPPHNICRGEQFLSDLYGAVRNSPYRDKIMLVILFDEHGGCYDHVAPPTAYRPTEFRDDFAPIGRATGFNQDEFFRLKEKAPRGIFLAASHSSRASPESS